MALNQRQQSSDLVWIAMCITLALPCLLVLNTPPTPQPFTELAALAVWGWLVTILGRSINAPHVPVRAYWEGLCVVGLIVLHVLWAGATGAEPPGMSAASVFLLGAAAVCLQSGARVATSLLWPNVLRAFFIGCAVLGAINVIIAFVQYFYPVWATDFPIARALMPGRAIGNVRQPNHLATLLVWSAIAVVPLIEIKLLPRNLGILLFTGIIASVMLTASRTGAVELLLLFGWGLLDRRLSKQSRLLLLATPIIFLTSWVLTQWWSEWAGSPFGAGERLSSTDISGAARLMNWRDAWSLIKLEPWWGVGFGNFNFAQTLTPSAERSGELVGNAHNLPLHLAAELGVPSALTIMGLICLALRRAWHVTSDDHSEFAVGRRAAFMFLLPVVLHSQLEFPLWSAYFLLPSAWVLGLCLALQPAATQVPTSVRTGRSWAQVGSGVFMIVASLVGAADYLKVVGIYENGNGTAPMIDRIAYGSKSWFFGHHADYAAATSASHPWLLEGGFQRALHFTLDGRLMVAWARTLHEKGEEDKARFVAARLREMKRPESTSFFQACSELGEPKPFQCLAPTQSLSWRSFQN